MATAVLANHARATKRPADTTGGVLVLMYHKFGAKDSRYVRSLNQFEKDLQRLYDLGFRPVTMAEYLANDMPIPSGASPVVITLDDSAPSQFLLRNDGSVDPECGFGVWQEFASTHPDFPVKGTWYVVPTMMWGQPKWREKKIQLLKEAGSELGSHTWSHPDLRKLNDKEIKSQIAKSMDYLAAHGFDKVSFAYPYGILPRHMKILDGFWLNHKSYTMTGAVTCDPRLAPAPGSDDLKPFKVPRIQPVEGVDGLDFWLNRIKAGKTKTFVAP